MDRPQDMGALPGSRASTEPQSPLSLGPSGFDPERIVTLRQIIREVPNRFESAYARDREHRSWRGDCTIGEIIDRLGAVDTETATPADIEAIIGNGSWTELDCDNCGNAVEIAATFGEEPDYESRTAVVCLDCVRAAAIAMEALQGGDGETRLHPKDDSAGRQASPIASHPRQNDGA